MFVKVSVAQIRTKGWNFSLNFVSLEMAFTIFILSTNKYVFIPLRDMCTW